MDFFNTTQVFNSLYSLLYTAYVIVLGFRRSGHIRMATGPIPQRHTSPVTNFQ